MNSVDTEYLDHLIDLEGANLANDLSNRYSVTFDEVYALFIITKRDVIKTVSLTMDLSGHRNFKKVVMDYYNN